MNLPNNLFYTKEHEWIRLEKNLAFVGITDFGQNNLGKVMNVHIDSLGKVLSRRTEFGEIHTTKGISHLLMPLSGKVIVANAQVTFSSFSFSPSPINNDPFGEGWIIIIDIKNPDEKKLLLTADEYKKLMVITVH